MDSRYDDKKSVKQQFSPLLRRKASAKELTNRLSLRRQKVGGKNIIIINFEGLELTDGLSLRRQEVGVKIKYRNCI